MSERTWIARLTPTADSSIERLLNLPLGLDVWERHPDALVVAATENQLTELERRRLAEVERWSTREDYVARRASAAPSDQPEAPL